MSISKARLRVLDAALALITRRGGADVTMAEIARAAHVSRQAVYLHFADRAGLFVALVRYADVKRGLAAGIQKVVDAPDGLAALHEFASLEARQNPRIWAVARALDAVRRVDEAAERSWQDRLESRLEGCRGMVARLEREGRLRADLPRAAATDFLWTMTSLRVWEDLVLERGWTAEEYEERMTALLARTLTTTRAGESRKVPKSKGRAR